MGLYPSKKTPQCTPTTTTSADQFQGVLSRSCPGQPLRERHGKAYNLPFAELSHSQRAAAETVLGIIANDESAWEEAMPRRIWGCQTSTVLTFQSQTWKQLSTEQQRLARDELDMSERFWNHSLVPFHDDLWSIPEITLSSQEFSLVLSILSKMAQGSSNGLLTKKDLAKFLLNLGRVLLPSQGLQIIQTLRASNSWESLSVTSKDNTISNSNNDRLACKFNIHLVVASFLTNPERFVEVPHTQLNIFWDDDNGGCVWGNALGDLEENANCNVPHKYNYKTYAQALNETPVRRCVASILTGTLPARVKNQHRLPPVLPRLIVQYILDDLLGTSAETTIDPFQVSWLIGQDNTPFTIFF